MIPIKVSENFVYGISAGVFAWGGPIGEAFARIMAVAATCEADFQKLLQLFQTPDVFGSNNRINVSIDPSIAPAAAGVNHGYQENGQTQILIVPTFAAGLNADAAARGVFVHEMAEVLMSYRNQKLNGKWIENYSTGESLAQICSAELHPEGRGGPSITPWLNFPQIRPWVALRPNWVDQTEATDGNIFSYGCGMLFLNYLLYQRNIPLEEIIAKGGSTLGETYQNLTGRTDGWTAFSELLNTYFPFGFNYSPLTDNLFPLPQLASLTMSPDTIIAGYGDSDGESTTATLSLNGPHPGFALKADLSCPDNGSFVRLPSPVVVINQNQTTADFTITTPAMNVPFPPAKVMVYATNGGVTVGGKLTVKSAIVAGILKSVTLSPAVVTGGQPSQGTVTLEAPVSQKTDVGLAVVETGGLFPRPGDESSVASLKKNSVPVPAGDTTATFTVDTTDLPPHVSRTATVLAHAVVTKSAVLKIEAA